MSFALFSDGGLAVVDPSFKEEAMMGRSLTVTVNTTEKHVQFRESVGSASPHVRSYGAYGLRRQKRRT